MRILHILHEFPVPPNSGIRCDMWRRLLAFRELGHQVMALTWIPAGQTIAEHQLAEVEAACNDLMLLKIGSDAGARARRIWNLRRHPSYVAARIPAGPDLRDVERRAAQFAPDLIWVEGIHPSWLGLHLRARLGVPLAYRSHNVEHRYLPEQARLARSMRQRLALRAGCLGLERAERAMMRDADHVFDISHEDAAFWRAQGAQRIDVLMPQADPAILATATRPANARNIDLLYVGSLSSPNNIAGLQWYFDQVHPAVITEIPDLAITVAGRAPPPALRALCEGAGTMLVPDPADISDLIGRGRVMLNPILHGSGVNIKTIDMLASGQPVITTTKGARGIAQAVVAELSIADDPAAFARLIVEKIREMRQGSGTADRRSLIEAEFGAAAVGRALATMKEGAAQ